MKFNREQLDALIALPDDKLWEEVVKIAKNYGLTLPDKTPEHAEIEKMRELARSPKINTIEALRMVNKYKKG